MESQKDETGRLIFKQRVQKNISEKELSKGLCSISEYRKIEKGEKAAGRMLLNALFERLGCASDNFSVILEKKQYELYDLHNRIEKAYLMQETEKLYQMTELYKDKISKKARCEHQFYCKMKFLMEEHSYHKIEEVEETLISIIQITVPNFTIDSIFDFYFCKEEIFLCCLLASRYLRYDERKKAKVLLENLMLYVEKSNWDIEEKVKVYPAIVVLLFQVYDVWTDNEKWLSAVQKAISLLSETSRTILIEELLAGYQIGMKEKIRKRQRKFTELEEVNYKNITRELECIRELKKEYNISYKNKEISIQNYEYNEVYLLPEMILDYRTRAGHSQIKLGEMIDIEWETISRYENGRSNPGKKNYWFLSEEMGLPHCKHGVHLPVEKYEIYQKIREIEQYLFRHEFILAEQLFLEIEPLISKESAENKQYCIWIKAILEFSFKRISEREKLQRLETALYCTFPNFCVKKFDFLKHHIPKRHEAILLSQIAVCYEKLGERETAIQILKTILDSYKKSKVKEEYHSFAISLVMVNYLEYLGRQGNYKEALDEIEKVLKMQLEFQRGSMIPYLIYAKGWNLLKMEENQMTEEKKELCMKYYRQAYWISGFINDFIMQQKIEKLYRKDFGREICKD